jgi:hypothetical protein
MRDSGVGPIFFLHFASQPAACACVDVRMCPWNCPENCLWVQNRSNVGWRDSGRDLFFGRVHDAG